MKNQKQKLLITLLILGCTSFFSLLHSAEVLKGYTHEIHLCNVGLVHAGDPALTTNRGNDLISYSQNGRAKVLVATRDQLLTSEKSLTGSTLYNKWDVSNQLNDVSTSFSSDFLGVNYFWEYCYTWKRVKDQSDLIPLSAKFQIFPPKMPKELLLNIETNCTAYSEQGYLVGNRYNDILALDWDVDLNQERVECSFKFWIKEINFPPLLRPHQLMRQNFTSTINVLIEDVQ